MKKIALYCRVSTTMQTTENQRPVLVKYAESNGLVYEVFEEQESTRKKRRIKEALMKRLLNKEFDAVVVYKLDRWARSSIELMSDTKKLIENEVGFISLTDHLDFTSAAGRLQFQILSAFAEFERSLISERTKNSISRMKSDGTYTGGRRKGDIDIAQVSEQLKTARELSAATKKEKAASNPYNRQAAIEIRKLRDSGLSLNRCASKLNEMGFVTATGKKFSATQVARLVTN